MPVSIPQKPQTLRQAKKAYQKASGPRISDAERRRLQRAEQLQERADHIKEKDKRKRINRKKKEEKEQKERDTRRRMGVETESEEKLSPRQVRIGAFFGQRDGREDGGGMGGTKRRKIEAESTEEEEKDGRSQSKREPLKEIRPNMVRQEERAANGRHSNPEPKSPPAPLLAEEDWASFFVSSTQIAREISDSSPTNSLPPQRSQSPQPLPTLPPPAEPPSNPDVVECLALLSSQDLEDYEEPPATSTTPVITTRPQSPQKPPNPNAEPPKPPPNLTFSDLPFISTQDLAFTDEDLRDLGLALRAPEPPSPPRNTEPANASKPTNHPKSNPISNPNPKPNPQARANPKPFVDPGDWNKENTGAHKDMYYDMLADCEW